MPTTYKHVGTKRYDKLAAGDIIQLQMPFHPTHGRIPRHPTHGEIPRGEMFDYIEHYSRSIIRARRISTGKTYKIFVSKFINYSSMTRVSTFVEDRENCLWNKTK